MGDALSKRLKQSRFESSHQEAVLNILVAADHVKAHMAAVMRSGGITSQQYNVLRILRGAGAEGHSRCAVAERMLDRSPDVTRILDRMEKSGLVRRSPGKADRRTTITRITPRGLAILETLDGVVRDETHRMAGGLSEPERQELSRLLEKLYSGETPPA
jgi:DNA-binding MarR family transcriptional regulator